MRKTNQMLLLTILTGGIILVLILGFFLGKYSAKTVNAKENKSYDIAVYAAGGNEIAKYENVIDYHCGYNAHAYGTVISITCEDKDYIYLNCSVEIVRNKD